MDNPWNSSILMSENLIIVFAKPARSGEVKTRLAKDIGNDLALEFYKTMLFHTRSVLRKIVKELECDIEIHLTENINESIWDEFKCKPQVEGDLGQKMYSAFHQAFKCGYKHVVLIGSDLPELSSSHLKQALLRLENSDLVLGPSKDGGYYLIAMNKNHPELFTDIQWSTETVLKNTLEKAANLKSALLPVENDVDTIEDLLSSPGMKDLYRELLQRISNKHPY